MKYLFVALLFVIAGCDTEDKYRTIDRLDRICPTGSEDKIASFSLDCMKSANPKSDEEPEDWINQCMIMAKEAYCPEKRVTVHQRKPHNSWWRDVEITIAK